MISDRYMITKQLEILQWNYATYQTQKESVMAKKRDGNVLAEARQEISLRTRTVPDKTKYKRKVKHKGNEF